MYKLGSMSCATVFDVPQKITTQTAIFTSGRVRAINIYKIVFAENVCLCNCCHNGERSICFKFLRNDEDSHSDVLL